MSESVQKSADPGEDKKEVEASHEENQVKNSLKSECIETKKDDAEKSAEKSEASQMKDGHPIVQDTRDSVPATSLESTATTRIATERTLASAPSIKIEPDVINDMKNSQGGQSGPVSVKIEQEIAPESTTRESESSSVLKNTVENTEGHKGIIPANGSAGGTLRTAMGDSRVSSNEPEETKSKDSSQVQLSGSSTETIGTPSLGMSSLSEASTPSVLNDSKDTKTEGISISEKEDEKMSVGLMIDVKNIKKEPLTDTEVKGVAAVPVINESDKMEIDYQVKSAEDNPKDSVKMETKTKDDVHKTAPSTSDVQSRVTGDVGVAQKPDIVSVPSFSVQPRESVTVDIVPKKETLPQMVVEQSKAVHEIIAEQSSRLDGDRLPTPVHLDRKSLSVSPVGENPIPTSVPSSVPTPVTGLASVPASNTTSAPTSVPITGSIPVPVPLTGSMSVPGPLTGSISVPGPLTGSISDPGPLTGSISVPGPLTGSISVPGPLTGSISDPSSTVEKLPMTVPSERENLDPAPVAQEKSEPVPQADSQGPTVPEPKVPLEEPSDDWDIPASDEEEEDCGNQNGDGCEKKNRKVVRRGYWEPPIDIIVDLYQKIDKEGILELNWKCPGRRPPSEEGDKEVEKEMLEDVQDEEAMEIPEEEDPTEFDFDMDVDLDASVQKMTPRRNIGQGQAQGSGKKRVARMDKVLNDIFRHRKIGSNITDSQKMDGGEKDADQAMDTSVSPILAPRPTDKFHIRNDLN